MNVGPAVLRKVVAAQDSDRDRVALAIVYWCGLRRNELRLIQFRHVNLADREVTIVGGKGDAWTQSLPESVAQQLKPYVRSRMPDPDEYLLYPQRIGRRGSWPDHTPVVTWEDRLRPLSTTGVDKWWQRCVANSGLEHFRMHDFRFAVRRATLRLESEPVRATTTGSRFASILAWPGRRLRRLVRRAA